MGCDWCDVLIVCSVAFTLVERLGRKWDFLKGGRKG